jgi:hypothetical protein
LENTLNSADEVTKEDLSNIENRLEDIETDVSAIDQDTVLTMQSDIAVAKGDIQTLYSKYRILAQQHPSVPV